MFGQVALQQTVNFQFGPGILFGRVERVERFKRVERVESRFGVGPQEVVCSLRCSRP